MIIVLRQHGELAQIDNVHSRHLEEESTINGCILFYSAGFRSRTLKMKPLCT